jgi:hypothetical protein
VHLLLKVRNKKIWFWNGFEALHYANKFNTIGLQRENIIFYAKLKTKINLLQTQVTSFQIPFTLAEVLRHYMKILKNIWLIFQQAYHHFINYINGNVGHYDFIRLLEWLRCTAGCLGILLSFFLAAVWLTKCESITWTGAIAVRCTPFSRAFLSKINTFGKKRTHLEREWNSS